MYYVYPNNMDKLIINALIVNRKINSKAVLSSSGMISEMLDRLDEFEFLGYVTHVMVDGVKEYYPSTKFLTELAASQNTPAGQPQPTIGATGEPTLFQSVDGVD